MKRIVLVLMLSVGALLAGATNASAGTYCSVDPTVAAGTPGATWSATSQVGGSNAYAHGNGSSTTFGGGAYIP